MLSPPSEVKYLHPSEAQGWEKQEFTCLQGYLRRKSQLSIQSYTQIAPLFFMVSLHTYSLQPGNSAAAQEAHLDRCFKAAPQTSVKSHHTNLLSIGVRRSL